MKTPAKRGAPQKTFDSSQRSAQYAKASKIADQESLGAISKAATIKSNREGLTDASYVYRKMEGNVEMVASDFRKAEKAAKKPCKYDFTVFSSGAAWFKRNESLQNKHKIF